MKHHFADTASELGFGVSTKFWGAYGTTDATASKLELFVTVDFSPWRTSSF